MSMDFNILIQIIDFNFYFEDNFLKLFAYFFSSDDQLIFSNLIFQDWQPPFAVNVDKFTFVPRIQKLNELEVCCIHTVR